MKYLERGELWIPTVELTRRNLLSLLAKLDGSPPDSDRTIVDPDQLVAVKAVEDIEHYADREPGLMVEATEAHLSARDILDELWDGVPGLDDPRTLAELRNFLESRPRSGYFRPASQEVNGGEK